MFTNSCDRLYTFKCVYVADSTVPTTYDQFRVVFSDCIILGDKAEKSNDRTDEEMHTR